MFDAERGELTRAGKHVKLTGAEQQLMKLFAANAGPSVHPRPAVRRD